MTRDYVKYKTFEELKEELGDKFEEYMYKSNIELLKKLNKIKEILIKYDDSVYNEEALLEIEQELEEIE